MSNDKEQEAYVQGSEEAIIALKQAMKDFSVADGLYERVVAVLTDGSRPPIMELVVRDGGGASARVAIDTELFDDPARISVFETLKSYAEDRYREALASVAEKAVIADAVINGG